MKRFFAHLKWQLLILSRNNLINISIAVTVIYALIFYFIKDLPGSDKFLTLLIFNDPVIICLFFVAISVIMEKNQEVLPALFVTPMPIHTYLLAKIISMTIVGWLCATGMTIAMLGLDVSWINFSLGIIGVCIICGLLGLLIVSYADEFLRFTIRSIPVMLFISLPLLNYFELTNNVLFNIIPIYGALELLINSYDESANIIELLPELLSMLFWIGLLYYGVFKIFSYRVRLSF
ncbi:MAG: ABC transporter permease [Bacteroidia bacterium]|nr:ABC transporter permease [Bacteroidia bacterium]